MELEKLKKMVINNKPSVLVLKQFSEKLKEGSAKPTIVNDLPKLLPVVLGCAFSEDEKLRTAALPVYIELVELLDLNKHLKDKPWWSELKQEMGKRVDMLSNMVSMGQEIWSSLWCATVDLFGSDLRSEMVILNKLLKVVEKAFKMNSESVRVTGFQCWCKLIDNFAINRMELNNKRRLNLLVIPLRANNHNTNLVCASKMKTWKHLLSKIDQHNEMTVQLLISHFLTFMFEKMGSIPPACQILPVECCNVFKQLLKTPMVYRIQPESFIKYTFTCLTHVHQEVTLALSVWHTLLDNLKHSQWAESQVTELIKCLTEASHHEKFGQSKTLANMIHDLYSGNCALQPGLVIKHYLTIVSLALEPRVMVHFSDSWCSELLNVVPDTDPALLPHNIVGHIIEKLTVLSSSEMFREDKLMMVRSMWVIVTSTMCKWMADDQIGKHQDLETDMRNLHQLLILGAAQLSSMWNKFQLKTWKTLYSECVKFFSLVPEAKCDKFVSDLIALLLDGVRDNKIPLHISIDLVSIVLEFHLAKDISCIIALITEIAGQTMNMFHQDVNNALTLLTQYLKTVVAAARTEPLLVNDTLAVIEDISKIADNLPLSIRGNLEKSRSLILKTKLQMNALKPTRNHEKSDSAVTPASSPTMTSFLHRLAKAKETKAKLSSPTPSLSFDASSSPSHTPSSKKATSPFSDLKSEEFVFVPPKTRKMILTDHQKESLKTRRHDIPALYQDLSQDSSQSALDSIVTSVQRVEEKLDKETVFDSPKKEKGSKEHEPKVSSPRKPSNFNLKIESANVIKEKQSNKENNNETTKSPFSSITKQDVEKSREVLSQKKKTAQEQNDDSSCNSIETADTPKSDKKSRGRLRKCLMDNIASDIVVMEDNDDYEGSDTNGQKHQRTSIDKRSSYENMAQIKENSNDTVNCNENASIETYTLSIENTPMKNLRKNKLAVSYNKDINSIGNDLTDTKDTDAASKISEKKSPTSNKNATPKVSPRRLRKRKSGVTPVLSGGKFTKKKRLSSSPNLTNNSDTRNGNGKNSVEEVSHTEDVRPIITEPIKDENSATSKKNESLTKTESFEERKDVSQEKTVTNEVSKNSKEIIKTNEKEKEDSTVAVHLSAKCSPVKVVLSRLPLDVSSTLDIGSSKTSSCINKKSTHTECKEGVINTPVKNIMLLLNDLTNKSSLQSKHTDTDTLTSKTKDGLSEPDVSLQGQETNTEDIKIMLTPNKTGPLECNNNSTGPKKSNKAVCDAVVHISNKNNKSEFHDSQTKRKEAIKESDKVESKSGVNADNLEKNQKSESLTMKEEETGNENCRKTRSMDNNKSELSSEIGAHKAEQVERQNSLQSNNKVINGNGFKSVENANASDQTKKDKEQLLNSKENEKCTENCRKTTSVETNLSLNSTESEINEKQTIKNKSFVESPKKDLDNTFISALKKNNLNHTRLTRQSFFKENIEDDFSLRVNNTFNATNASCFFTTIQEPKTENKNLSDCSPYKKVQKITDVESNIVHSSADSLISKKLTDDSPSTKSGQKQLRQTQLPFTPVRKSVDCATVMNEKSSNTNTLAAAQSLEDIEGKSPAETDKVETVKNKTENAEENKSKYKTTTDPKTLELFEASKAKCSNDAQEAPRTPEKKLSPEIVEIGPSDGSIADESPEKMTESEDIIASSQDTVLKTQSFLVSDKILSSNSNKSPNKLLSKSPKKCEVHSFTNLTNSNDRVLRSSPVAAENTRLNGTPLRKSVCRRLDVEIDLDCEDVKQHKLTTEESLDDITVLNGYHRTFNGSRDKSKEISATKFDPEFALEDGEVNKNNLGSSYNCTSPHKNLKRLLIDSNCSSSGSPKKLFNSLKVEGAGSPKSPSSRTNQMVELAMQDKEKTISSPVNSMKKRRVSTVRLGPVLRTPKIQSSTMIERHRGPSEEWVRRTYSPSASPNSSILKRTQMVSPESSPPSLKKKRVSFLDPPVSESLLFSKANPGTGQIQRPEAKQEKPVVLVDSEEPLCSTDVDPEQLTPPSPQPTTINHCLEPESEELPSQGSLDLAVPQETGVKVFSPLKHCPNPLTDILERITSLQWTSEMEAQLQRLGVTTIGQLSSLTETTIERLPFIPPKLDRLKKILQNYYNEINEKPTEDRIESVDAAMDVDNTTTTVEESSNPDQTKKVSSLADTIKQNLELYPELITELGKKLDVDTIWSILKCAINEIKTGNGNR